MRTRSLRTTTGLALAALAAWGCAHPSNGSTTMSDPTRDENKRSVESLFDTFNHDDLGPLDRLVSPDYVGPQGDRGPAGFRKVIGALRAAFPDIRYRVDDVVAENDRVAVNWHWTGT